jgi:hypothetical protein
MRQNLCNQLWLLDAGDHLELAATAQWPNQDVWLPNRAFLLPVPHFQHIRRYEKSHSDAPNPAKIRATMNSLLLGRNSSNFQSKYESERRGLWGFWLLIAIG